MSSMPDQPPPRLLQTLYGRLSRRYGAPGVCLRDFPGRWLVFRTTELAAGLERAVIDVELPMRGAGKDLAKMESTAQLAVGENHDATLVLMYLARRMRPGRGWHAAPAKTILAITVWSLAHTTALTGRIELDEAGTPLWIGMPDALPRAGNRRTC
ncbi:hypothetical protein [Azohydromonas australica]|uniref:hypothetical protein n=1 Tax=Azohydromonas australica TaxID=364039 RepID=UPI0004200EE0|nr:hypothetical protein [Azohydromonas australica]